jgi:hypothetical protein
MFDRPIQVQAGERVGRDGFTFVELLGEGEAMA